MAYASKEDERAYQRAYKQRARKDSEKRAVMNARNRQWRARKHSTTEGREHTNQYAREYYHRRNAVGLGDPLPSLPARPLAEKIDELIKRTNAMYAINDPLHREGSGAVTEICAEVGIAERQLGAWRNREVLMVHFDIADRVLQRAGWLWWDVYHEGSVRMPILVVVKRSWRKPKRKNQEGWWVSIPGKPYGDRAKVPVLDVPGYSVTDWEMLAMIERAFTGEDIPVETVRQRELVAA